MSLALKVEIHYEQTPLLLSGDGDSDGVGGGLQMKKPRIPRKTLKAIANGEKFRPHVCPTAHEHDWDCLDCLAFGSRYLGKNKPVPEIKWQTAPPVREIMYRNRPVWAIHMAWFGWSIVLALVAWGWNIPWVGGGK